MTSRVAEDSRAKNGTWISNTRNENVWRRLARPNE